MKYILASNNPAKRAELEQILGDLGIMLTTAKELGIEAPDPVEDGETFADNALIKAGAFMKASGLPAIADDSGLCVDALGGRPGVHSARYGGDHDSASAIKKLLGEMEGVPAEKRTARFECHIICLYPDGRRIDAHGVCEGFIAARPRGSGGFGFDPVFCLPDGRCFGEMTAAEKHAVSHRGRALRELRKKLGDEAPHGCRLPVI